MRLKFHTSIIGGSVLLVTALLAACGPSPAVQLTLNSSSATVMRGQSIDVAVALERSGGATAEVVLSADVPSASGVTATFAPTTLSGSNVTSTLTLAATGTASEGPVTITVSAIGSGLAASQTFVLTVDGLMVRGKVVSWLDSPIPDVTVSSQGVTTVSAADGSFELAGLSVPYDVTLSSTAADAWAHVFEGLSVPEPMLMPYSALASPAPTPNTATLSGTLTGGVLPLPAGRVLKVCVEGLSTPMFGGCDALSTGDSTYSIDVKWFGSDSAPAKVHALEYAIDGSGQPTSYDGYATATMTLTDAIPAAKDITLGAAPATTTLSGDVDADVGVTVDDFLAGVRLSPNLTMTINQSLPAIPFSLLMPDLPGATFDVLAGGSSGASGSTVAWKVDAPSSSGTLTVLPAPVLVAPAPSSTGVTVATQFEVSNPSGGVLTFLWTPSGTGPAFAVTTTNATAHIPDVAAVPVPSSSSYEWATMGTSAFGTVDEASGVWLDGFFSLLHMAFGGGGPGPSAAGSLTTSASAPFTTAP